MGEYALQQQSRLHDSLAAIAQDLDKNQAQIEAFEAAIAVLKRDRCHLLTEERRVKQQLQGSWANTWQGQRALEA